MRGVSGQKDSLYPIAIYHSDVGPIQRQPCGVVKPDIPPARSFVDDLLKTFECRIIRFIRRNLGLELEGIRAGQRAECDPPSLVLGPGVPGLAVKSVYSNIADLRSLPLATVG
jgi:hypothetical protein